MALAARMVAASSTTIDLGKRGYEGVDNGGGGRAPNGESRATATISGQ
jgi:hypothetical protein